MTRKNFERSDETARIIEYLRRAPFATTISFDALSKGVGFKVTSQTSSYQSAKRALRRDHGEIVESVRGVGCAKLSPSDILKRTPGHMRSIRKRAKTGETEIEIAISGNLDRVEMLQATENFARFRIISANAQPAETNRVPTEAPEKQPLPTPAEIAKALKK